MPNEAIQELPWQRPGDGCAARRIKMASKISQDSPRLLRVAKAGSKPARGDWIVEHGTGAQLSCENGFGEFQFRVRLSCQRYVPRPVK